MKRRIFIRKLISWLSALLILVGLGSLAYRLFGSDEKPSPDYTIDPDIKTEEDPSLGKREETTPEEEDKMIPRRQLGKTGYAASLFSLGGEATIEQTGQADKAESIINRALDAGVNYIDTAPAYGGGGSESNIGQVMEYRREEVFLATKTNDRSYDGTMRLIEESLKRLRTDYLDLYQLHNIRTSEDLNRVFAADGAVKAIKELKEQEVIRFTGITGHKDPDVLLQGINEYDFDCLLMGFNVGDVHYAPFQEKLLREAVAKEMGIIAMKVVARGRIFRPDGITTMKQALDYVFSFPISTAIVGISKEAEIDENVRIASEFKQLPDEELRHLEDLVAAYSEEANFYKHQW